MPLVFGILTMAHACQVMEDKSVHVVHCLEVTVAEMYYSSGFCISEDGVVSFTEGGHYYPTQLLVI